jgi:FAD/FMN-containing dehydrogenase
MNGLKSWGLLVGMLLLSGCITEATVELTKAPFDATTALTNGTSEAVGEVLEPTKKFLSSTTPGAVAIDRLTRAREKTELFVGYSYEHLRAESAQGSGEHVASLAVLAGIPSDRLPQFQEKMREAYSTMFNEDVPTREARLRLVNAAWSEGFGKLESEAIKHRETGISDMDLKLGKPRKWTSLMSMR